MAPDPVEDHLLVECAKWTGGTDLLIATAPGVDPAAYFDAQLRALAAIGLLSDDEVAAWRRRLEASARADDEVVVDGALRARTERYLESLLRAAADEEGADRLEAALQVLIEIGVLDEDERERWFHRAYAVEHDEDDEGEDGLAALDATELHGVLLGPRDEADGVRITSLELYSDGVVVRWSARRGTVGGDALGPEPHLALSDDTGTAYEETGGGSGSGGSELTRGASEFVPGVPEAATRLVLRWPGGSTAFELSG